MKKMFKSRILIFILGIVSAIGITSVFAYSFNAIDVGFTPRDTSWKKEDNSNITDVSEALDSLYTNLNSIAYKRTCIYVHNNYAKDSEDRLSAGTKYQCEVGDGITKDFYVLNTNGKIVNLIMDRNITTSTLTWANGVKYFNSGQPGYSIRTSWTNVFDVRLPRAQEIADASNIVQTPILNAPAWWCLGSGVHDYSSDPWCNKNLAPQQKMSWLFNHLNRCADSGCDDPSDATAGGYWTSDITATDSSRAWYVYGLGYLEGGSQSNSTVFGIRPVITVLTSNIVN